MIVVDSTIIVAWGVETPWSGEAARLLAEGEPLIAPQAALTRAWEALRQLQADGHIPRETYQRLSMLLPAALAGIAADQQLLAVAADLVAEFALAPEPALCLALAQARRARLATADPVLAEKACALLAADRVLRMGGSEGKTRPGPEQTDNGETAMGRSEMQDTLEG